MTKNNTILKQIRKNDVVVTRNGKIEVERISYEALKVLDWYNMHIAANNR